jgi:RNA polymerase sigma factor (sigma-70 family)
LGLDEELALQLQQGNQAALEDLVQRYYGPLHAYILRMGGEYYVAVDLVQEVFIKVCRHIGNYRNEMPFKPWIYTIASNTYKDYLKKAYVQKDVPVGLEQVETAAVTADTPETIFLENAERERIGAALQRLGEIYREVLVLRYYQDLKLEEIAMTLNIPVGTVKSRLSTALYTIKELLVEEGTSNVNAVKG